MGGDLLTGAAGMSKHHYREEMKKHTAEEALMKFIFIVNIMICT